MLWFSPRIIDGLRSYIKHSKGCFIQYPSILKLVKKNLAMPRFFNHFSMFRYWMKHSSSCLVYYIKFHLAKLNFALSHLIFLKNNLHFIKYFTALPSLFFYNFFVLINLVIKFLLTITDILQSEILCPHHRKGRIKQHSPWKHIFEQTFYLFLIISISGLISKPLKSMISPVSSGMKTLISGIWFLLAVMRNHMHQQSL